jgi:hypothetical protein
MSNTPPTFHPLRIPAAQQLGVILADALGLPDDVDVECLEMAAVDDGAVVALDALDRVLSNDYRIYTLVDAYNMLNYGGDTRRKPRPLFAAGGNR